MCTTLRVHHSGYYQWLKQPESNRARENQRLTALIKESWLESGGIYGSPRIHVDLREAGETLQNVTRIYHHHHWLLTTGCTFT